MPQHEYGVTVDADEAAAILKIHQQTVKEKARKGDLPGTRIGRRWVFVTADLLAIVRGDWGLRERIGQSASPENRVCRSTAAKIPRSGGSNSSVTDKQYKQALGLPIVGKPRSFTIG